MSDKHSPRPWLIVKFARGYLLDSIGEPVAYVEKALTSQSDELFEANLRVMAAAPGLLDRLKLHAKAACLGWNNRFNAPSCLCGPCLDRAAIAKVEAPANPNPKRADP